MIERKNIRNLEDLARTALWQGAGCSWPKLHVNNLLELCNSEHVLCVTIDQSVDRFNKDWKTANYKHDWKNNLLLIIYIG